MRYRRMIRLLLAFGLLVSSTALVRAQVAPARAATGVAAARVDRLRIDPRDPQVLYVGGQSWMSRSTDGGDTFADLSKGLGFFDLPYGYNQPTTAVLEPLEIDPNSRDLYTIATYYDGNAKARLPNTALLRSTDGGARWQRGEETISRVVTSPFSSARLYGLLQDDNIADSASGDVPYERHSTVVVSNDGGRHFTATSLRDASDLVADPTHPDTVYANGGGGMVEQQRTTTITGRYVPQRSEDAGGTWTAVMTPTVSPALGSFAVATDPHEPGLLVGRSADKDLPGDRLFLSRDEGRGWTAARCPGALHGACPVAAVDNVFGAGRSYAFYADGLHPFVGAGPSGARLALSDRLPFPLSQLIAVAAGSRFGDPIYLLGNGVTGTVAGMLYRSTDGGKSWRRLALDVLPNAARASASPGAMYVAATRHSVAAPFVGMYRRLGLSLIGYPITEAYLEGDVLTQTFQRLELELHGGRVAIARLGVEVYRRSAQYDPSLEHAHSVTGDLLRFWQQHGGKAVFGAPISDPFSAENGDGSGRMYRMQFFEHARLELHPEAHDPRYAVQVGLLGLDALRDRAWLTGS